MEKSKTSGNILAVLAVVLLGLSGLLGIAWIVQGNEFFLYKVFAPRQEAVRRQVFEQSRAFNQGMIQELENMQLEYVKQTDPGAKAAIGSIILHRASGYNLNDQAVPAELRSFVECLRYERSNDQAIPAELHRTPTTPAPTTRASTTRAPTTQ
jgi:hypothetical protein